MRSNVFALIICALLSPLLVRSADAKPRRVVVLEFDGPRKLADAGRSSVMALLGEQYSIVATKIWDAARARASGRGPQQWRQASKQAGVDAVIEGWVQQEGRHNVLTVAVREAATGNEIDTLSVRIKDTGVTTDAQHKMASQLDDVLSWIDGDITADPQPSLPDVRTIRPMLGGRDPNRERERERLRQDEEDEEEDDRPARHGRQRSRRVARDDDREPRDEERRDDDREPRDERDERDDKKVEKPAKPEKTVAAAAAPPKDETSNQDTNDLVKLFGPDSKEAAIVTDGKTAHVPKPTPRFMIGAGPYLSARGITFTHDPTYDGPAPEYPASTLQGLEAHAAVYPLPREKQDGDLSGVGFTFDISKSVLSQLTAADDEAFGDYTLDHLAWQLGVHYRWPMDLVTIDAAATFGNYSYTIHDLPETIQLPDVSYPYLGLAANVDLKITEGTSVGVGATYRYTMSAGDVSDEMWYGSGTAWGMGFDGHFVIPVHGPLYVRGAVEYRRVQIDLEGSGMLSQDFEVWDLVDSEITGSANLGVKF